MSLQLPTTYGEFVEHAFARDRDQTRDSSLVIVFARQFTAAGECAFGAAGECGCCGQTVLNVEPFVEATNAHYRLNEGQRVELRARLMDAEQMNATEDGICGRCKVGL